MRWSSAVNQRDRLKGTSAELHIRHRLHQAQRRDPVTRCSATVKGVLPSAQEFRARLGSRANIEHLFLCVGIRTQFVNATCVIDMNMGDQRTVQPRNPAAHRLLSKIHARINDHGSRRCGGGIAPLHQQRTAKTLIAHIL